MKCFLSTEVHSYPPQLPFFILVLQVLIQRPPSHRVSLCKKPRVTWCFWPDVAGSASPVTIVFLLFAGWTDFQCWGHYHCVWVHGWWWILLREYWGWEGPVATSEVVEVHLVAGEQKSGKKYCKKTQAHICLLQGRVFLAVHVPVTTISRWIWVYFLA